MVTFNYCIGVNFIPQKLLQYKDSWAWRKFYPMKLSAIQCNVTPFYHNTLDTMSHNIHSCTNMSVGTEMHVCTVKCVKSLLFFQEQVTGLMERKEQLKEELGTAQEQLQHWKDKYKYEKIL